MAQKGEITIDEGMNFMHCLELKGEKTNFIGRKIDDKCIKKTKKINNNVSNKKTTNEKSEDVSNKVAPEN